MESNPNNQFDNVLPPVKESGQMRNDADGFRTVPHGSVANGNIPKASEPFGTVRNDTAGFRSVPKNAERKENHTLTVRETARMFEAAGVARTERSIINWCQPNRTGVARLDAYYDPNERKYFISPQSVELAIAEEKAKAAKLNEPVEPVEKISAGSEDFRTVPNATETMRKTEPVAEGDESRVRELERENLDLKITNRGKDYLIDQLKTERTGFFNQLLTANRKMGELETKLLQLETPKDNLQSESGR